MSRHRLLIIDDHPVVLTGLRLLLAGDPGFDLVGEAVTPEAARTQAEALQPDLIVTDLVMGGADGIALVEDLIAGAPSSAVLVYSSHDEQLWAPRALRAGARGFVSKAEPLDAVAVALGAIVEGNVHVSPAVQRLLVADFADTRRKAAGPAALSVREQQVLQLTAEGHSPQTIGLALGLSVKTVGTYRERLKVKLGLDSVRALERVAPDYLSTLPRP